MRSTETEAYNQLTNSWCLDVDTRDSAVARRNILVGLWAGQLLGLTGDDLSTYAVEVHRSDFQTPGDSDVVGKIADDFASCGFKYSVQQIRAKLVAFHREAIFQTAETD
jgi:hypothetical protein